MAGRDILMFINGLDFTIPWMIEIGNYVCMDPNGICIKNGVLGGGKYSFEWNGMEMGIIIGFCWTGVYLVCMHG
jgi:hypothetical protein